MNTFSIIGSGLVGSALAGQFARSGVDVGIANSRGPQSLADISKIYGDKVTAMSLSDALNADYVLLAIPFWAHRDVARASASWKDKVVIDATNAYGVPLSELDNLPSSKFIANALPGAHLVKAFNHLPAGLLALDPRMPEGRRVIFVSGDDATSSAKVAVLVERLGFAPVSLGKLAEGGQLVQARDKSWAPLIFQDLFKREN